LWAEEDCEPGWDAFELSETKVVHVTKIFYITLTDDQALRPSKPPKGYRLVEPPENSEGENLQFAKEFR
tara:strand:- start:196 stop:402 length:207 start_codon:yes stop_codon:yes gene_type:complete